MIKHFNTALGAASGSASSKGSKGGNALIWVLGLSVALFAAYKYIESRNKIVTPQND